MNNGAIWMVAGLAMAALEMLAPGVFLIWIGLAALGTGAATELAGFDWPAQIALFVVLTATLIAVVARRLRARPPLDPVNAPAAGLIGQTCHAVTFQDGEGRVALGDGTWSARTTEGANPAAGQALRVVGLDGTTLLVAPRM